MTATKEVSVGELEGRDRKPPEEAGTAAYVTTAPGIGLIIAAVPGVGS